MQVGVLAHLRNCLRLSLAWTDDHAREVLISGLLVLGLVNRGSVVAARLISRRLLELSLKKLIPLLGLV